MKKLKVLDAILDPQATFEAAANHWRRCRRCRSAGMERAKRDMCATGRNLMRAWDNAERIYETAEAA